MSNAVCVMCVLSVNSYKERVPRRFSHQGILQFLQVNISFNIVPKELKTPPIAKIQKSLESICIFHDVVFTQRPVLLWQTVNNDVTNNRKPKGHQIL